MPTVWIDTETTGVRPGYDRACQVALVRFEGGREVDAFDALVDPERPIPAESTAVHGILDAMIEAAAAHIIADVFDSPRVVALLEGAQPGAYNAAFDRAMVPPFGEEPLWPWLDPLTIVRVVDRYVGGKGRHGLSAACARHGVVLEGAHGALPDARAAGELWYKLMPKLEDIVASKTLGDVLCWQRHQEAEQWHDFNTWRAKQPPPVKP